MKLNTNSNIYIFVYSTILVIVVAFLLAFIFQVLKPLQDKNVVLDVKKQILYSLNIRGLNDQEAEAKYADVVKSEDKIDDKLYYFCKVDGQSKYVFPLKGMGLWGGISGFVSVDDDLNTIYGAYFIHESETAGLGAEIKDSREWQERFQGKKIFGTDGQLAIAVVKKVDNPESQVDAVTGATLTSNGVSDMLRDTFSQYANLLEELRMREIITEDSHRQNADGEFNE